MILSNNNNYREMSIINKHCIYATDKNVHVIWFQFHFKIHIMSAFDLTKIIPEWINEISFFDKIIRHKENDQNAKVISFDITPASKAGENFASAIFRSKVIYSSKYSMGEKAISLIIKTKPVLGPELASFSEIYDKSPFFRIEMAMYGNILPDIQSLLSTANDKEILSPRWSGFNKFLIALLVYR